MNKVLKEDYQIDKRGEILSAAEICICFNVAKHF